MFTDIGTISKRVVEKSAFLKTLDNWAGLPFRVFPKAEAPCVYIEGCDTENAMLANTFALMAAEGLTETVTDKMSFLGAVIEHEKYKIKLLQNAARGTRRTDEIANRDAWIDIRHREQMIAVMWRWFDALHTRACEGGL